MSIYRFILNRLLQTAAAILGVVTLLFVVLYVLVPGDAAQTLLGMHATPDALGALRHQLGLDRALPVQYGLYLWRLIHFDLGTSYVLNESVSSVILRYLPATAYLAFAALILEAAAGIGWGMFMAGRRSRVLEAATTGLGALLLASPVFFLGMVLQYIFASRLGILPISGLGGYNPLYLLLPAITLAAGQSVVISAVTRSSLEIELRKPYILAGRARGLSTPRLLFSHAARNAMGPVVTLLGLHLGMLLGGAMITEIVFSWPGIGRASYLAAESRDVPLIIGTVIVLVTIFVIINSLLDIFYRILDPRIRSGGVANA